MFDYHSLSDSALLDLREMLMSGTSAAATGSCSSLLDSEVTRRATALCHSVDGHTVARCRLENWTLLVSQDPRDAGAVVLAGCVYGDRYIPDGTRIVTGALEALVRTDTADLAFTTTRIYKLAAADPIFLGALLAEE